MRRAANRSFFVVACSAIWGGVAFAGPLTPPTGPIVATDTALRTTETRTVLSDDTTPGDATALFVITQPGSYVLTEFTMPGIGQDGIRVDAPDVTIDLNGYLLLGNPTSGMGVPEPVGIRATSADRLVVRDGNILRFLGAGIDAAGADDVRLENLVVFGALGDGVRVGARAVVTGVTSSFHGGDGFRTTEPGGRFTRCAADQNDGDGFDVVGAVIDSCTTNDNEGNGFHVDDSIVRDSQALGAQGNGFRAREAGARFEGCRDNGGLTGFFFRGPGHAIDCTARNNFTSFGSLEDDVTFERCHAEGFSIAGFSGGSTFTDCHAVLEPPSPFGTGFNLLGGATASGCSSRGASVGFNVARRGAVVRACDVVGAQTIGILAVATTIIERCTVSGGGDGIRLFDDFLNEPGDGGVIRDCVVLNSTGICIETRDLADSLVIANRALGNATDFVIGGAGTRYGGIITGTGLINANAVQNIGETSTITATP